MKPVILTLVAIVGAMGIAAVVEMQKRKEAQEFQTALDEAKAKTNAAVRVKLATWIGDLKALRLAQGQRSLLAESQRIINEIQLLMPEVKTADKNTADALFQIEAKLLGVAGQGELAMSKLDAAIAMAEAQLQALK